MYNHFKKVKKATNTIFYINNSHEINLNCNMKRVSFRYNAFFTALVSLTTLDALSPLIKPNSRVKILI